MQLQAGSVTHTQACMHVLTGVRVWLAGCVTLQGRDQLRYNCRCSCLEIYNETITDLLNPGASNLQLRDDQSRGVYVEGLSEREVVNGEEEGLGGGLGYRYGGGGREAFMGLAKEGSKA